MAYYRPIAMTDPYRPDTAHTLAGGWCWFTHAQRLERGQPSRLVSAADIPDDIRIGDFVMKATETIVPQLPEELHAILAQRVAIAALEALGDTEGASVAQRKLDKMEISSTDIIDNRVEGAPQKIVNRHSPLKQGGLSRSNRRGRR
jgi:dihydropteroate synthase